MIHYGLQYQKLIQLAVEEVLQAKLDVHGYQNEVGQLSLKAAELLNKLADANVRLYCARAEFNRLVDSRPFTEVEAFKSKTGRYPI